MKIAVVGLGYVGLPLTILLALRGYQVIAIDKNEEKVKSLQKNILPFALSEPLLKQKLSKAIKSGKVNFTNSFKNIGKANYIIVAVETPIKNKKPNYKSLKSALITASLNVASGATIIVESTLAPRTTMDILVPLIKANSGKDLNKDYYLAVVPERIRPNHIFVQLTTLSRVIGISSKKIEKEMRNLYKNITTGEIDIVDPTTAEVVKTVENTYRDVNIAFANQIATACEEIGVNVWEVRELVNKSPFHNMHKPGAGVGGHCIPKDPWLLASSIKKQRLKLLEISRAVNDQMPMHILDLAKEALKESGVKINSAKLALLGFSYVENSEDIRNSPTAALVEILKKEKVEFEIHDPNVTEYSKKTVEEVMGGADCLILMVSHINYVNLDLAKVGKLMRNKIIIDGRNFFDKEKAQSQGFIYKGVGNV